MKALFLLLTFCALLIGCAKKDVIIMSDEGYFLNEEEVTFDDLMEYAKDESHDDTKVIIKENGRTVEETTVLEYVQDSIESFNDYYFPEGHDPVAPAVDGIDPSNPFVSE